MTRKEEKKTPNLRENHEKDENWKCSPARKRIKQQQQQLQMQWNEVNWKRGKNKNPPRHYWQAKKKIFHSENENSVASCNMLQIAAVARPQKKIRNDTRDTSYKIRMYLQNFLFAFSTEAGECKFYSARRASATKKVNLERKTHQVAGKSLWGILNQSFCANVTSIKYLIKALSVCISF